MSYVHEKYKTEIKGKTTKAVVAMLCKMKTMSLLEFYLISIVPEENILLKHDIIAI